MRASAQMVSYELAIGFVLVTVLLVAGSLNMTDIVMTQTTGQFADMGLNFLSWNWLPLLPLLVIYMISAVAETNRHPFDVVEGESEIVAGDHVLRWLGCTRCIPQLYTRLDLAGVEDIPVGVHVHLVPRIIPALSLRPNHASGLEGVHSADTGLAGRGCCLDADSLEHLELIESEPCFKLLKSF
jgi:hypothetical protein